MKFKFLEKLCMHVDRFHVIDTLFLYANRFDGFMVLLHRIYRLASKCIAMDGDCIPPRPTSKKSVPVNLLDCLHQVLCWALGSVEMFLSRHCRIWYGYGGG